jgi:hypothetical protein
MLLLLSGLLLAAINLAGAKGTHSGRNIKFSKDGIMIRKLMFMAGRRGPTEERGIRTKMGACYSPHTKK